MAPSDRAKQLHIMISDEEDRMLRTIAEADGLTSSDIVRQLVRREFVSRWPPKRKKRP